MSGRGHLQFVPSLEALDERVNPSPVVASAEPNAVAGHVRDHGFVTVDRTQEKGGGISKLGSRLLNIQSDGADTAAPAGTNEILTIGGPRTASDTFYGTGVYKSTDAGSAGSDGNVIYVPTSNGGVWKTADGGSSTAKNVYTITFGGS